jgi:hypothetical protein
MSPETTEQEAPYAYPNAVLGLIHRYREGALPDPITPSALKPFGISPNNAHRLLGALGLPETGEALLYVATSRSMVRRLARLSGFSDGFSDHFRGMKEKWNLPKT